MYKITNFIYQSKGSRNIYEKDMYNSMWKRKFGINIQTTDRWKQKMCILVRSESMSGVRNYVFRKLGYIIGETWILRPNDIVLENYDLAFDSKAMR